MKCASNPIPGLLFDLLLFLMCYAQCCGDGSGVRHVHIKYYGHLLATVLELLPEAI